MWSRGFLSGAKLMAVGAVSAFLVGQVAWGRADLVMQSISLSPKSVQAGKTVTVKFSILNQGNEAAPASTTAVVLSSAGSLDDFTTASIVTVVNVLTPSLAAGAAVDLSASLKVPAETGPGAYYVWVVADLYWEVDQDDYDNDYLLSPLTVSAPGPLPDLIPQNITLSSTSVPSGGVLTVNFTVLNSGNASAGPTKTGVFMSTSGLGLRASDPILTSVSTPALNAGASADLSATATIPAGTAAGTYYVWIVADMNHVVNQGNITNDSQHSSVLTVSSPPPSLPR